MATPRKRWPEEVDNKRVEAQQLADEAARLIHEGSALIATQDEKKVLEGRLKLADARTLNERIGRLMSEARHP